MMRSLASRSSRILQQQYKRLFHEQTPVSKVQTIQLLSLLNDQEDAAAATGIVKELLVRSGEPIAEGQLLARVASKDDAGILVDIHAPRVGVLVEWHVHVDDAVAVGDDLVSVDVKPKDREAPRLSPLQQAWMDHWKRPDDGAAVSKFWEEHIANNNDAVALQELAVLMEQSSGSQQRSHALRVYERLLILQADALVEQAQTQTRIGTLCYRLGDLDMALVHLRHALKLHQDNNASAKDAIAAAHIHLAAVLNRQSDFSGCLQEFKSALKLQQEHFGPEHPVVAASLNNVGAILYSVGNWDGAIDYYQQGLIIHQAVHGEDHADTAGSYNNLGIAYKHKGDYGKAMENIQKALKIRKVLCDGSSGHHPDVAASHFSLAQLLSTVNELDASLEQYQAALTIQESIYGRQHAVTANTINNMGAVKYQQQNYSEALELYETGLEILNLVLARNADQPELAADVASCYNNVGLARLQLGCHEDALEALEMAKDLQTRLAGADDSSLAVTVGAIGKVYKAQGKLDDALAEFQTAHAMLERSLGADNPDVASSHNNIGLIYAMQGRFEDALKHYENAKKVFQQSLGELHPYVGSCYFNMGLVMHQQADIPGAMHNYMEARDAWRSSLGPDHPQTIMSLRAIEDLQTSPAPVKQST